MILSGKTWSKILAGLVLLGSIPLAQARDAAFLDPGIGATGASDEAIKVEPKGDIDTGESILNVARHTTVFFVNQTGKPILVEKVSVNSDGNVAAEIANDDCSKQGSIPAQSRCSVEVSVTPSTPGGWSVDILLTHDGAGRIARSKLTGKTTGSTATTERKDTGLALSNKESAPVSFGDVEVGAKAVRSALMVNDSPEPITLYAIDVIEASNGLQRLEQGCAVDMELKPGESCPVTLIWTPTSNGQVSTDLIIRHSGRLGFAVIPIRGNAKGLATAITGKDGSKTVSSGSDSSKTLPPPPSAQDLEKSGVKIPQLSAAALGAAPMPVAPSMRLIGSVGNRAVLLNGDGTTSVVTVGDEFDSGGFKAKLISINNGKTAVIMQDGRRKTLTLSAAPELMAKARGAASDQAASTLSGSPATTQGAPLTSTLGAPLGATPETAAPAAATPLLPPATGVAK